MGMKLHRGRKGVFHKKNRTLQVIVWLLVAIGVVALGFFGAKLLDKPPVDSTPNTSSAQPTQEQTDASTDVSADSSGEEHPVDTQPATPNTPDTVRAFYLPTAALRDTAGLTATLQQAVAAGYNSVVFDLKDSAGALYYRFTCAPAQQVNSYTTDAFTADELTALFATLRQAGVQPIPRLYAFQDHAGARALAGARITPSGNSSWVWYDGDPQGNGRAWLNPYADEAHSYIIQLAQELKQAGATILLLDGVQFPKQTSQANFGSSANANLPRDEVLTLFVNKVKMALEDCTVLLGCTATGALGTDTGIYGGNPLTFTPNGAVPSILPSSLPGSIRIGDTVIKNDQTALEQTVQALVAQMVVRTKVMPEDKRPHLVPMLQAEGYTATQIKQEIAGCIAGGAEQYILYNPTGQYDFAGLN